MRHNSLYLQINLSESKKVSKWINFGKFMDPRIGKAFPFQKNVVIIVEFNRSALE